PPGGAARTLPAAAASAPPTACVPLQASPAAGPARALRQRHEAGRGCRVVAPRISGFSRPRAGRWVPPALGRTERRTAGWETKHTSDAGAGRLDRTSSDLYRISARPLPKHDLGGPRGPQPGDGG